VTGVIVAVPAALSIKTCLAVLYDDPQGQHETKAGSP